MTCTGSIPWCLRLEHLVRIVIGGSDVILRMRGDAIHQVIGDLGFALAGLVGTSGF